MITALNTFAGLSVDNIAKAKEFYVDTLALELVDDTMGLQLKLPGGAELFIYEKPDHEPASYTALNFVVEDINEAIDHLAGHHGIVFERYENLPAEQDDRGVLRGKAANAGPDIAWFKDPAGNTIAVIEA